MVQNKKYPQVVCCFVVSKYPPRHLIHKCCIVFVHAFLGLLYLPNYGTLGSVAVVVVWFCGAPSDAATPCLVVVLLPPHADSLLQVLSLFPLFPPRWLVGWWWEPLALALSASRLVLWLSWLLTHSPGSLGILVKWPMMASWASRLVLWPWHLALGLSPQLNLVVIWVNDDG